MIAQLLGNFMVHSNIISEADLQRVLDIQDKSRMKLGVLAVMEGFMTNEQTRQIHFLQMMVDKRFGEIAVEKGYLTENQVEFLLEKQGNEYLVFVQHLIDENLIGIEEADAVLYGYQIENGFSKEQMQRFKKADIDSVVEMYLPVGALEYKKLAMMAVKAAVRCVDSGAYIGQAYLTDSYEAVTPVIQRIEGKRPFTTAIGEIHEGMPAIADLFGHVKEEDLEEDMQDACAEFLNCVNGLYVSDDRLRDYKYELEPPAFEKRKHFQGDAILILPIYIGNKSFAFIVTD